jgi:hypothetical protein
MCSNEAVWRMARSYGAVGTNDGTNERSLKRRVGPQMRRINGKLTAADRSGALVLLAHNPKVAGSNPAPQSKAPFEVVGFRTSPDWQVGASY